MVGKNQIKFIKSLQQKKYRNQHGLFVVEGIKTVQELLDSHLEPFKIYCTDTDLFLGEKDKIELVTETDLRKISGQKNPNKVLGVFKIPKAKEVGEDDWILALDDVRDPGNLGTIIRLCDWFGIPHLVCSGKTVDCYNPKVLQATMGSMARVNVVYMDLEKFLKNSKWTVYGTFMDGVSVYDITLPKKGVLLMGNEANGISKRIGALTDTKVGIPRFGNKTAESLNVATATAVFLSEIRRK